MTFSGRCPNHNFTAARPAQPRRTRAAPVQKEKAEGIVAAAKGVLDLFFLDPIFFDPLILFV